MDSDGRERSGKSSDMIETFYADQNGRETTPNLPGEVVTERSTDEGLNKKEMNKDPAAAETFHPECYEREMITHPPDEALSARSSEEGMHLGEMDKRETETVDLGSIISSGNMDFTSISPTRKDTELSQGEQAACYKTENIIPPFFQQLDGHMALKTYAQLFMQAVLVIFLWSVGCTLVQAWPANVCLQEPTSTHGEFSIAKQGSECKVAYIVSKEFIDLARSLANYMIMF